LVLRGA